MQVESGGAVRASQVLGVILPRLFNMEILPPKTALVDRYFQKLSPIVTPTPKKKQTTTTTTKQKMKKKKRKERTEKKNNDTATTTNASSIIETHLYQRKHRLLMSFLT